MRTPEQAEARMAELRAELEALNKEHRELGHTGKRFFDIMQRKRAIGIEMVSIQWEQQKREADAHTAHH